MSTKVEEITAEGIAVIDRDQKKKILKADNIILASGLKKSHKLFRQIKDTFEDIRLIGDAKEPRRIREAISEGYISAFNL